MTLSSERRVVDASVAAKWFLLEELNVEARAILRGYVTLEFQLIAPPIFASEIGSLLVKRYRRKLISEKIARGAMDFFSLYQPTLIPHPGGHSAAFDLAMEFHISFWDACYVALAQEFRCDLITADRRFYESARKHYPFMRLLGAE